jgi:hypothetical protein
VSPARHHARSRSHGDVTRPTQSRSWESQPLRCYCGFGARDSVGSCHTVRLIAPAPKSELDVRNLSLGCSPPKGIADMCSRGQHDAGSWLYDALIPSTLHCHRTQHCHHLVPWLHTVGPSAGWMNRYLRHQCAQMCGSAAAHPMRAAHTRLLWMRGRHRRACLKYMQPYRYKGCKQE